MDGESNNNSTRLLGRRRHPSASLYAFRGAMKLHFAVAEDEATLLTVMTRGLQTEVEVPEGKERSSGVDGHGGVAVLFLDGLKGKQNGNIPPI